MALELVSFTDLKNLLGLEKNSISDYPALSVLRDSVTFAIEAHLQRELESKQRTEVVYCFNQKMVSLKGLPIAMVTSVVDYNNEALEYYIRQYGIELTEYYEGKLTVIYTGGLSAATGDLKRAALLQTAYEWQGKDQIGAESVSTEGGTVNRPELQLLKEVKNILRSQKHPMAWV